MKHTRLSTLWVFVVLMTAFLLLPGGRVQAQTYLTEDVPASAPARVKLFQFNTPSASPGSERVVMAKFVVDDVATDLEFRLETTSTAKYVPTDFRISQGNVPLNDSDTGDPVATLRVRDMSAAATPELTANNSKYRIIRISIAYNAAYTFPGSEVWEIRAKQPASGTNHFWGFWAEGTGETTVDTMVTRPKLINYIEDGSGNPDVTNFGAFVNFPASRNITFGDVHINLQDPYVPDEEYQFINVGTKGLGITGVVPVGMPASAYAFDTYPSPPLSTLPMGVFSRRITCKPTALGNITNVDITMNTDSSDYATLQIHLLNSTGIRLKSAILFDLSGSMLRDKNDMPQTPPYEAAADQQKVYLARLAALELVELYGGLLPDAVLGLYSYPHTNGTCPTSQELIPLNEIKNNEASFKNHLDVGLGHPNLIKPKDAYAHTPMAEGIAKVYEKLSSHGTHERTGVFHFGDGQHNCNSTGARKTPADWYNWSTFQNAGIPFFTIPYGAADSAWINTFTQLAQKTDGEAFPADITNDLQLQTQFKKALGKALELETLQDPEGSISAGATRTHEVCVTASSYQMVFTVHWTVRNQNAIQVKVETPDRRMITPSTASTSSGNASYISGRTYAGYVIRGSYLRGGNGSGLWKLHLKGNVTTPYAYQIQSMDRMKTEVNFDLAYVGKTANLLFAIKDGVSLARKAKVTAYYNAPASSFQNYLATTPIDPKLVLEAPKTLAGRPLTLAERKLYALTKFAQKPFVAKRSRGELILQESPGQGRERTGFTWFGIRRSEAQPALKDRVYKAEFKEVQYQGPYWVTIKVEGLTARQECFEREYSVFRWADVALSDKLIEKAVAWRDVKIEPYFDPELAKMLQQPPPKGFERKMIHFTPRDEAGNYLGVGRAPEIEFSLKDAQALGPLVDNLDGSYSQVIQFKEKANPQVRVSAGGATSGAVPMKEKFPLFRGCAHKG